MPVGARRRGVHVPGRRSRSDAVPAASDGGVSAPPSAFRRASSTASVVHRDGPDVACNFNRPCRARGADTPPARSVERSVSRRPDLRRRRASPGSRRTCRAGAHRRRVVCGLPSIVSATLPPGSGCRRRCTFRVVPSIASSVHAVTLDEAPGRKLVSRQPRPFTVQAASAGSREGDRVGRSRPPARSWTRAGRSVVSARRFRCGDRVRRAVLRDRTRRRDAPEARSPNSEGVSAAGGNESRRLAPGALTAAARRA